MAYDNMNVDKKKNDLQLDQADINDAQTTEYYDPTGQKQTGYLIDNKTYKDPGGVERIDVGSMVQGGGKWWEMTPDGGVEISAPFAKKTSLPEGSTVLGVDTSGIYDPTPNITQPTISDTEQPASLGMSPVMPVTQDEINALMTPDENEMYGVIDQLTNAFMGFQPTETMSQSEAVARATAQLRQPFQQSLEETMKAYDKSAIERGMFGQMPTEALKREAMAGVELQEQQAIQELANQLYQQDFEIGQAKDTAAKNLLVDQLAVKRAQLAQEQAYRQESTDLKTAAEQREYERQLDAINQKTAQEQAIIDDAYKRWEALGSADEYVSQVLGIPTGTLSGDNQAKQMELQYDMALEEYQHLLALEKLAQDYGYDISKIGYASQADMNEAMQKAQIDLQKLAASADIDIQKDLTKLMNEYAVKKDYETYINDLLTPEFKLKLFNQAIEMAGVPQDVKNIANDLINTKAKSDEDFDVEKIFKEYKGMIPETDINRVMDTYKGLLYSVGSEGGPGGIVLPESDYGITQPTEIPAIVKPNMQTK